jgi:hypothetical protein
MHHYSHLPATHTKKSAKWDHLDLSARSCVQWAQQQCPQLVDGYSPPPNLLPPTPLHTKKSEMVKQLGYINRCSLNFDLNAPQKFKT